MPVSVAMAGYDANMTFIPPGEMSAALRDGERLIACVAADGFHASKHSLYPSNPHVAITGQRIVLFSRKGMMKKRLDEEASWPLAAFTERINSNEGRALGPFLYVLTLFTKEDETVSTGFRSSRDREAFKEMIVAALGPVLG